MGIPLVLSDASPRGHARWGPRVARFVCVLLGHALALGDAGSRSLCTTSWSCRRCGQTSRAVRHASPEVVPSPTDPRLAVLRCPRCQTEISEWMTARREED